MRLFYFGCWNGPGHYWFGPQAEYVTEVSLPRHPFTRWIDTGWAPRFFKSDCFMYRHVVADPKVCFAMEGLTDDMRQRVTWDTEEHPQGQFLLHQREGWTLMSWWDRTHGDSRSACNGNLVAEGEHEDVKMFDFLDINFHKILTDLIAAGVVLKNITPGGVLRK